MELLEPSYKNTQRIQIIEALENEIIHFSRAFDCIRNLPLSCSNVPETNEAYNQLMDAYRNMINVRHEIINKLRLGV